jgi:phage-related baseplate assembly protein
MRLMDLSQVPPPAVVESLDYEAALDATRAQLAALLPTWDVAAIESDPANKLLEVAQYLDLLLRARINVAARAGMLASTSGADLDALAARYNAHRLPGESDARFRARTQIAYHQVASAGSRERYIHHAMSQDLRVQQVDVWSTTPGRADVALAIRDEQDLDDMDTDARAVGRALFGAHPQPSRAYLIMADDEPLFVDVRRLLLSDAIAPVGADVRIHLPAITTYTLTATLVLPPGPDPAATLAAAQARLTQRLADLQRFRVDVHRAALHEALLVTGVRDVELTSPAADLPIGPGELAVCTQATLTTAVRDD